MSGRIGILVRNPKRRRPFEGGSPPRFFEVRMPALAVNPPPKRRRGGQPGNSNRLRHGRWSKAYGAREAYIAALIRKGEHFCIRLAMIARARAHFRKVVAQRIAWVPPERRKDSAICTRLAWRGVRRNSRRRRGARASPRSPPPRRRCDHPQTAGWNSSTTLPDGSCSSTCLPPGPMRTSLRNGAPASRRRATSASISSTMR